MWDQLKTYQDKEVVLELINGRKIFGTVAGVERQFVRLETDEGVVAVPVDAVQIILEPSKRSLTQEHMEQIVKKMSDFAPN
ncbi:MAG: hypothetical protein ABSC17_04795 [Thermacetogeniaceae bacterium]